MKTELDQWALEYLEQMQNAIDNDEPTDSVAMTFKAGFEKCRKEMLKRVKHFKGVLSQIGYVPIDDVKTLGSKPAGEK